MSETITDADYVDDQALLENTPAQAKSKPYRRQQSVARNFGLFMNSYKTDFISVNQDGVISVLNDRSVDRHR